MSGRERTSAGAERELIIDGTFNVRDIGGRSTLGGARVASGRLFRSATLDAVTDQGIETLTALGLRTVLDLRSPAEVERHGRFPVERAPVRWEHLASAVGPPAGSDDRSVRLREHPDPMAPMYIDIIKTSGPEFARGLRILADPANHPAIVHCTSGKDRTGVFVLLLHLVLGVSLEDALDHYLQDDNTTDRAATEMISRYPEMAELPRDKVMRMAGTRTHWMSGALATIGGDEAVPAWLASHGCDQHVQARLRAAFIAI